MKTILLFCLSAVAGFAAVNTTTPGPVVLFSTFECISVKAYFTNDANANNSATVQFRKTGSSTWLSAYPPIIDRRTAVVIEGVSNDNSNNLNQARGSIVSLIPNTSYDVLVTWTDADGLVGNASSTNVISTLTFSPPTNGVIRYVDGAAGSEGSGTSGSPWKTITNAVANANAGDTILVASNLYVSCTLNRAGTSSAYFVLRTTNGNAAIIDGGAPSHSLNIASNYWVVDGFTVAQSQQAGIYVSPGCHDIYVQNTLQTNGVVITNADTAVTSIQNNCYNIYLLTNTWSTFNSSCTNDTLGNIDLIELFGPNGSNWVISANVLIGGWDSIGNRNNSGFLNLGENSDFCHNRMTNWIDDGVELDGLGPNIRFWDNRGAKNIQGLSGYGGSVISDAGTYIGPAYVFRNMLAGNVGSEWLKMGHSSVGFGFYFHNTCLTTNGGSAEILGEAGGSRESSNKVFRCNILLASGNPFSHQGRNNSYDYDLGITTTAGQNWAFQWNDATDYLTFAAFQVGTSAEPHGSGANPSLNGDLTIGSSSPAVDAGVLIANFNDATSGWPFSGAAPDIGAFEAPNGGGPGGSPAPLRSQLSGKHILSGRITR